MWSRRKKPKEEAKAPEPVLDAPSVSEPPDPVDRTERTQLLMSMYAQTWNNINRHITVVWQTITTLIGSLALLGLVEKGIIGLDMATSVAVIVATWLIAHTYDASVWFNRNINIISRIEAQFLKEEDKALIHNHIGETRPMGDMILHYRIQVHLALIVGVLMIAHHITKRIWPISVDRIRSLPPSTILPYLFLAACVIYLWRIRVRSLKGEQHHGG